jgi:hypothetical protein
MRWSGLVAVVLGASAACSGGGGTSAVNPVNPLAPALTGTAAATPGRAHQASAAVPGDAATVDLVSGATAVTVRAADLGLDRVRAVTPDDAGIAPALDVEGDVVDVHLVQTGQSGPSAVTVLLDRRVRWQVRLSGGATSQQLDLTGARLSGIDFAAGATRIDLRLPAPDRTVPVRMTGGASEFTVHVPAGVAAAVRVGGGAGSTEVDGVRRSGLPGGTVLSTATATDRYEVDAVAGVSSFVLDRD